MSRTKEVQHVVERDEKLEIVRRAYAKRVMFAAGVADRRIDAAFAAVSRERFLGPGPWQVVRGDIMRAGRFYATTPSRNPVYVYDDVVLAILPARGLNNGQPSLHARLIAAAAPRAGEHIVHIGTGTGYYTAILAHLAGRRGRVTGIEYDAALAARAAANFAGHRNVTIVCGDGARADFPPADVIYVNAGATRPADTWLDRLREGGRLILPLTAHGFPMADARQGAVFRIERRGDDFVAARISAVAIFPCAGVRDEQEAAALSAAFDRGRADEVARLYRRGDLPEEQCWVRGEGWCLAYR